MHTFRSWGIKHIISIFAIILIVFTYQTYPLYKPYIKDYFNQTKVYFKQTIFGPVAIEIEKIRLNKKIQNNEDIFEDHNSFNESKSVSSIDIKIHVSQKDLETSGLQSSSWIHPNGSYNQFRYYPSNQINHLNVNRLKLAFTAETGVMGAISSAPIVVNGVMFVSTAFNNIYAFDASTGKLHWHFKYNNQSLSACCGPVNRGISIKGNYLYMATLDGHLLSINATTGKLLWAIKILEGKSSGIHSCSAAPVVVENKILIGCSASRGFVRAFDTESGRLLWNFYTIPNKGQEGIWATKDATGHDLHRNIAKEKLLLSGTDNLDLGGNVWSSPSVDVQSRSIYFTTGDPFPLFQSEKHPGDNLYSASIVSLDLDTGAYKWHYQYIPHDLWDLDFAVPTVLADVRDDYNKIIPAVITTGKIGNIFIHDRATGKLIRYSEPMVPQKLWEVDKESFDATPSGMSGVIASPMAFNPQLNYIYALNVIKSTGDQKEDPDHLSKLKYSGAIEAVDVDTGLIMWKFNTENALVGGALATKGNLVFFGEGNGIIRALDAEKGNELWKFRCDAGANGIPISFEAKGKQYIAIGCGGHALYNFKRGNKFYVFAIH